MWKWCLVATLVLGACSAGGSEEPGDAADGVEILATGDGEPCGAGRAAQVHYTGTLPDGTEFDSSRGGEPFVFPVGAGMVIEGWDETVAKMRPGDRWRVTIPAAKAYGAGGAPPVIPPNTDLTFDIELLDVLEPKIEVLSEGDGPTPERGQKVSVHYVGTLTDGSEFDSSRKRDEPFELQVGVGMVIPGWDMALSRMKVGERSRVTIPWQLAYGAGGRPPIIPPKADLVFDMELLSID